MPIFDSGRKTTSTEIKPIFTNIKRESEMQFMIVNKKDEATDRSIIQIWSLIAKEYNYPLHVTAKHIAGRIPPIGDAKAPREFFKKYSMVMVKGSDCYDLDEALKVYKECLKDGIEMGRAPLMSAIDSMYVEYDIFDASKF